MSLYKQRNGCIATPHKPPTCDGCGIIISTHRSRWPKLWNKPVLLCVSCRSLVHPHVLRKKLAHIKMLLELEQEYHLRNLQIRIEEAQATAHSIPVSAVPVSVVHV